MPDQNMAVLNPTSAHRVCKDLFWFALLPSVFMPDSGWGLTIFRIGGDPNYEHPLKDRTGVNIVKMNWDDAARGFDGQMQGLSSKEGKIAPLRFPPDDNHLLTAAGRGGAPSPTRLSRMSISSSLCSTLSSTAIQQPLFVSEAVLKQANLCLPV